jgi:hypothetical protein
VPVNIQGKQYVTVAERVVGLHETRNGEMVTIETGIAGEDAEQVTMWAKVQTPAGSFSGHARSSKSARNIEGQSPLEVAETSAVGRALGFAGLGVVEGIATADEVKAAQQGPVKHSAAGEADLWAYMKDAGLTHKGVLEKLGADVAGITTLEQAVDAIHEYVRDLVSNGLQPTEARAYASILKELGA